MLLNFLIKLMVLGISSSIASQNPHPNTSHSSYNIFSKGIPMHFAQPLDMRPLKPSNHRLMNMQHMPRYTPAAMHHETPHPLEHFGVQPNYYNPRNPKGKLQLSQWRLPLMPDNHFERLPIERSSFSNQIPRPPRLTRTQSENRRRYIDTASEQPRPFNFPLEGPQPSEFKKTKKSKKKENKVNNIQDILRQEPAPNVNQYQMPVGIHISGSFKNLQNSGISNVFRRYIQLQPQVAPSHVNYQRVAFDPFYPYKPKSLNDINSLAMKQLGLNKKKKKTKNNIVPSLVFQPSAQRPVSADYYFDPLKVNNSLNSFGAQRNLKHEPFSLKLEVYPIRSGKKAPITPLNGAPFLTTIPPISQNFQPFYPSQIGTPYGMPMDNGPSYYNYMNMNNPQRYKGKLAHSPSLYSSTYQRDKSPLESDGPTDESAKPRDKKPKSNSNQLMVHLNVFPSKKESSVAPPPPQKNHLYDVIHADVHERSSGDVTVGKNESSSYTDCDVVDKAFQDDIDSTTIDTQDYKKGKSLKDSPVIVENYPGPIYEHQEHPLELGSNDERFSLPANANKNATGYAEKFSTFRFPVENLLQFQANDAVINN